MLAPVLSLLLTSSASAIVCPPQISEAVVLKQESESCGGPCEQEGVCAEGLKCVTPKTSPLSFAILMGPKPVGVCTRPMVEDMDSVESSAPKEKQDRLLPKDKQDLLLGRRLVGEESNVPLDDEGVVAAAKFAVTYVQQTANSLPKPALSRIVFAKQQVVAGMKYTLGIRMDDGHTHRITVIDTPWLTPRYKVSLFEPNALD